MIGSHVTNHGNSQVSISQLARQRLLSQREGSNEQTHQTIHPVLSKYTEAYHEMERHAVTPENKESTRKMGMKSSDPHKPVSTNLLRFTPTGRLEAAQKKKAGAQYLLFRRLYSDLEREQVRQRRLQRTHHERVERMKINKEADRRVTEDEVNAMESFTSVSSEPAVEREKAEQWAEMVALEERRHQLQRAKEMERYIDALKGRLRDRLALKNASVPPLCSCSGPSVWDAGPDSCANNCVFYRNPRGLSKLCSVVEYISSQWILYSLPSLRKGIIQSTGISGRVTQKLIL